MAQQPVIAGEHLGEDGAAKTGPVVADHRDGCRHSAQHFAGGLINQVKLAAIGTQILQPEYSLGVLDGGEQARKGVLPAGGRGDRGGEAVLGGVVDDRADAPDPTAR